MSWKRIGGKRELVAAPWTSSRRFSHVLWLKVHSHQLLRACLLGSKRKLPSPGCQVFGLPSVVCHPRGVQFPGTMYICCNQGPLSSAWSHCISCAPSTCSRCRRCCCCAAHLSATEGTWELAWTLLEVQAHTTDHELRLSCIYSHSFSSFQVKSLLTHSSSDSMMITKSLAQRSSDSLHPIKLKVGI